FSFVSCDEPFHGARILANFDPGSIDADTLVTPTRVRTGNAVTYLNPGDPGFINHYELHAGFEGLGTVRLLSFQIRPIFEVHHPCMQFIDDDLNVSGEDQYLNMCQSPYPDMERYMYVMVSVPPSDIGSANPGYNYLEWGETEDLRDPANTVTAPDCTTDASGVYTNRISYLEEDTTAFCANLHQDYYLGNPFQITKPNNGKIYGYLDGPDPRTSIKIGGINLAIEYDLSDISTLFITAEPDQDRISTENLDTNLPPGPNSRVLMIGETDGIFGYLDKESFEGVWHGLMVDPLGSSMRMEFTLYHDLDEDSVFF
ncbi:hypothetical protein KKF84_06825, partial [Myxococcota bacterium]|nr:hypothetical protein [Myxococcota bacterium]